MRKKKKLHPGVYVEEVSTRPRTIAAVATSVAAFVGTTPNGPTKSPQPVNSYAEFEATFGRASGANTLANAVGDFFANGGSEALIVRVSRDDAASDATPPDTASYEAALNALGKTGRFNLLCLPPHDPDGDVDRDVLQRALKLCVDQRAFLIVDPRSDWSAPSDVLDRNTGLPALNFGDKAARNAAVFFPRLRKVDPIGSGRFVTVAPCGAIAGVFARTDGQRGVWKAPAGTDGEIKGIEGPSVPLTDMEIGELSPRAVNCLRVVPGSGSFVWGARTLAGAEESGDEYKYIPVRRAALFIEESLFRGIQWVVFEPNDEPLWAQIRQNVGAFMNEQFRRGAFQGSTPKEAYFVKCDSETTTQTDIDRGIVNILVGFAPLKPAEFVVIKIQQKAGQSQV